MTSAIISIKNLSRSFDTKKAVDNVSLQINPGEIYALIGPNGAGKTTLIKMLVGLISPSSGSASISGFDIQDSPLHAKQSFGYLPDNPAIYDYLTGYEFLQLTGSLSGLNPTHLEKRIAQLSDIFPIKEILQEKMGNYSRGNRQKVGFLSTLLQPHQALIIDEPIVGLDPRSIAIFGKCLQDFVRTGGAVLLVTHTLPFAQEFATRVGVMHRGQLVHQGLIAKVKLDQLYTKLIPNE